MIQKISTGKILLNEELKAKLVIGPFIGRVDKIKVDFSEETVEESELTIETSDGENILSVQGNKDGIWYPRNWNAASGQYTGINVASGQGGGAMSERYLVYGFLILNYRGSKPEDFIRNIDILYDGNPPDQNQSIITQEGSCDEDESKAVIGKRGQYLTQLLKEYCPELTKSEPGFFNKTDDDELRRFIEESIFTRRFDGMGKSISDQIKDFIIRSQVKKYDKNRIVNYIERKTKGLKTSSASLIFRTETHELKNKVREFAFLKTDPEQKLKYKWLGPDDHRTTKTCERIKARTTNGVSMEKLKSVIQEETYNAKARGELPSNFSAREFTPHFSCRHVFVRSV